MKLINLKFFLFFLNLLFIINFKKFSQYKYLQINNNYLNILNLFNITFFKNLTKNIRIGIYTHCIHNGGRARITSLLVNYFNTINIFKIFLFTRTFKIDNEYSIPENIKRTVVKKNIIKMINKSKLDMLIYELDDNNEIEILNNIKNVKIIYYIHSSIFYWIYSNYTTFKYLYKAYTNSYYVISIIPFENDFLFEKWGINSILMDNFMTYEYNTVIPSDLSKKNILMIGRANNLLKRFAIGIQAMSYIAKELPKSELKIISNISSIYHIEFLTNNLNIQNNIKFVGFTLTPEIYFNDASLHMFPSMTEGFPLVLSETKIYGIPNIILGIDYVAVSKGGTIIIYDDTPEKLAKESIKILKKKNYRIEIGKNARKSMKKYNNNRLFRKWIKLIMTIYNGKKKYDEFKKNLTKISTKESLIILNNQVKLLKKRKLYFCNITNNNFKNFSFMEQFH